MRIACLGDLHVTAGPRLEDHRATLDAIVADIVAAEPDVVLVGGDVYGNTVPYESSPAEKGVVFPALVKLATVAPVVVVVGNHDVVADLALFEHLGGTFPIQVVPDGRVLSVPTRSGATAHIYALAYPTKRWILAGEQAPRGLAQAQAEVEARLGALLNIWSMRLRRRRVSHPDDVHVFLGHLQVSGSRTSGGEVLAGQEIELTRAQLDDVPFDYLSLHHIHLRQEACHRGWFPGSTWFNDHGEKPADPKGWHLVHVGEDVAGDGEVYEATSERHAVRVEHRAAPCRRFRTLDYRWGTTGEESVAAWIAHPDDAAIAACADAEVRMRVTVPETWLLSMPWVEAKARVQAAGAHRIVQERKIEPVVRVRAPDVVNATTPRAKLTAYWSTLAAPPPPTEQAAALAALDELETCDDETILARTLEILGEAPLAPRAAS